MVGTIERKMSTVVPTIFCILFLTMAVLTILPVSAGKEDTVVNGDLEGPDYVQPPKHYRTLEGILGEVLVLGPPPVAVSGTREILVILVELTDVSPDASHTTAHFWDRFFDTTPPSVRDFYDENSYGAFTYVPGAVMGWYLSTYSTTQWDADSRPAVVEAIQDVDDDFNFALYDADSDGTVTNEELTIFIIVSGDVGGAFHWWTAGSVSTGDSVSVEGEFSATHEWRHIGSYCHELGHDLGLPDLYDTDPQPDGTSTTGTSEGIGNYGLMGGGSWTFSHMDAWSKIQLGWITPTIITSNGFYDVHDAETHAEAYVLIDPAHSTTEYFLIENRHPPNSYYETVGPPVAPSGTYPDSGIVIYHIDETRMQDWITRGRNNVNVDETRKGVDVECADFPTSHVVDADDLDRGVNRGDSNDLWDNNEYDFHDTSAPCNANWYLTTPSEMDVRALPAPASIMTVYLSIQEVQPPVADANGPYSGTEGTPITLDASDSYDPDGFITLYEWDLDGDGEYDDATGVTVSYTWFDDYSGTIGLKVTDDLGQSDADSTDITIINVDPTVEAGPDQTVNEGEIVHFTGISTDPGRDDTHTFEWDFGDGTTASGTLTPTHVYGDNGVYTVTVTVTDDEGGVGTDSLLVTVNNVAPSIAPFGPFTADEGSLATLTATSTDQGSDDLTFKWEFEVGPTITTMYYNDGLGPDPYPSPGGTYPFLATDMVKHTYGDNGVYTVTLTVTDDDGGASIYTTTVTVSNVAPSISGLEMYPPNPDNPDFILPAAHTLPFTSSVTDPGSDDLTFTWYWDDGTDDTTIYYNDGLGPDPYPSPGGTYPFLATDTMDHIYSEPRTYTVTLTVEDDDGGVDAATLEVEVLSAEEAKQVINEYIQGLPDDAFKSKPNQRKKSFSNMFSAIGDMLADEDYIGAIHDLLHNIREKADGTVDGSPMNDWIIGDTAQGDICWKIDQLISYLETFL